MIDYGGVPKGPKVDYNASDLGECKKTTAMDAFIDRFKETVLCLKDNVNRTDSKLQKIMPYSEPTTADAPGISKAPEGFLENASSVLDDLNDILYRMESINRHLSNII